MVINGHNYEMELTVKAEVAISQLCPGKDIGQLGTLMVGEFEKVVDNIARIATALSEGYESKQKYIDKEYEKTPLQYEEIRGYIENCTHAEYLNITEQLVNVLNDGMRTEIQTETIKKNEQ